MTEGERLAFACDELNKGLERAEDKLVQLNLGVTASVPLDDHHKLVFGKKGSAWVLLVEEPVGGTSVELLVSSRMLRCAAAHRLVDLLEALRAEADNVLGDVERARDAAIKFVDRRDP